MNKSLCESNFIVQEDRYICGDDRTSFKIHKLSSSFLLHLFENCNLENYDDDKLKIFVSASWDINDLDIKFISLLFYFVYHMRFILIPNQANWHTHMQPVHGSRAARSPHSGPIINNAFYMKNHK